MIGIYFLCAVVMTTLAIAYKIFLTKSQIRELAALELLGLHVITTCLVTGLIFLSVNIVETYVPLQTLSELVQHPLSRK